MRSQQSSAFQPFMGKFTALFWKATPAGELRLGTVLPEVASQFKIGKEYYLDLTPAE